MVRPEGEASPGGSKIIRHEPRDPSFHPAIDSGASVELVDEHVEAHVGPVAMVWHEIVSEYVHIDIYHVEPGPGRPFHTLVTSGMSEQPMSAPASFPSFTHAELVALLPTEWPLSEEAFADESNYWPVRQLKILARLPHEYNTWLWMDHTVPNGDPPEPFAPSTQLCCSLLEPPLSLPEQFAILDAPDGRHISFFVLLPLYREEMEFKLRAGSTRFWIAS